MSEVWRSEVWRSEVGSLDVRGLEVRGLEVRGLEVRGLDVDLAPQIKRNLELVGLYDKLKLKNVGTGMAKATALFWGRFAEPALVEPLEVIRQGGG